MLKTNKIVSLILAVALVVSMFTIAFTSTAALSDGETWVVAGEAGLCGVAWNPSASQNRMSFNPENGNYEITYNGVAAGTYEFKVINGAAWDNPEFNLTGSANYGGGNASVTVDADGSTVLVGCDGSKAYVSVTAGGDTPVNPTTVEPSSEAPVTPPTGDTLTIYFQNNWVWPTVEMYYWGGAAGENAAWPGAALTADMIVGKDDSGVYDIYKIEVPADIAGIVFSGEGGYGRDQSEDVTDIQDGYCYYMTYDEATNTKPCASYPYVEVPSEEESSEEPSSEEPSSEEPSSEEPSSEEPSSEEEPEGLFVKADGVLYEVKQGDIYTYTTYLTSAEKVCSFDANVMYDTEGLDIALPVDEWGDVNKAELFPLFGTATVWNSDIDGEFYYNYSLADGLRIKNETRALSLQFKVTAESGIYEINGFLKDLAVVDNDKVMTEVRKDYENKDVEGFEWGYEQEFDAEAYEPTTPSESESSETPSESESSETPSESESSETPSESESSEVDPEGLFVKADGVLYTVKQGDIYTYTTYLTADQKVCSFDGNVLYDETGLEIVLPVDEWGDVNKAELFPMFGEATVWNADIAGEFYYNYSLADGLRIKNETRTLSLQFKVTAESGIYEINGLLKDLAVVDNNKVMTEVRKNFENIAGTESIVWANDSKFDAEVIAPTESESSETPSESESSETPSESESSETPSESESSETPSESESTETPSDEDPEGLFVKADGVLYTVKQGDIYTYTTYLTADQKVCSFDGNVLYDETGLEIVLPVDEWGDVNKAELFPMFGEATVWNADIAGEFYYNYSLADGLRIKNETRTLSLQFKVTAESGIYEINGLLKDLAVVDNNKVMTEVRKNFENIAGTENIVWNNDATFDAEVYVPTESSEIPSESESSEIPSESESSEIPTETESSETPSESTEPQPVKTYVVADGNWYEVEVGETFSYLYSIACAEKIGSLDATTTYDDGLTFNPSTDEYGDDVVTDMFPNVPAMVYSYDVDGKVMYNFTSTAGIRFPAGDAMTAKNIVFAGSFTVTGEEGGVYYINTFLNTLGDVDANAIVKNGEVVNPDVPYTEAVEIVGKTPTVEPSTEPTEDESESSEIPSESESSEVPSESESTEPSEDPSSETPSESESTEPSEEPSSEIPSEKPSEKPSEEEPTDAPSETVPAPATSDSTSTGDGAGNGGNGVQTGTTTTAIAFLAVLVMAAAAVMFARKRKAD